MQVANAYGMIQPGASDTSAVRATFIIDPEGILRAMVYYPMSNGRSIDEFVRLVKALQTSDEHKVATPEAWQPGDKVIVPPPATAEAAQARSHDLEHLTLMGAEDAAGAIVAVGGWEPASTADTLNGGRGLLLHGLYVVPALHGTGIGSRLLNAAIEAARQGGFDGLLVKANPDARGFFAAKGMQQLSTEDALRDYPYRFWTDLGAH